jgi:restriction system protein
MARREQTIFTACPWWAIVSLSLVFFVGMKFVIPSIFVGGHDVGFQMVSRAAPAFAWAALLLLIPTALRAVRSRTDRRHLETQRVLGDIRALAWNQFEPLVAEAYRRQRYSIQKFGEAGPEDGVDLVLKRNGNTLLLQCRQWKAWTIGINAVREMFGIMTAQRAQGAIILTSGLFTQDARTFAAGKPLHLVDGRQLLKLIRKVQGNLSASHPVQPEAPTRTR